MITFDPATDCPDRCCSCKRPLIDQDADLCACCCETVCDDCREDVGGLTHCPTCAASAYEFINAGGDCGQENAGLHATPQSAALPGDGQMQLPG